MTTPDESDDAMSAQAPPARPRMLSHQSNSLPSTPRQLARDGPFDALGPSSGPQTGTHSPRSASSESKRRMFNYNPSAQGCRFMSTQVSRRRMPYSDEAGGAGVLAKPEREPKKRLEPEEERKLTGDLEKLYQWLLPSADNQTRRELLLGKLRALIAQEWPGKDFEVHVFGSSGNLLYNDKSDVDICVVMKDLTTCALAELLNRCGMHGVRCVHAKIRIVKMEDPDLDLICDLNVNNELALTNTQMVKSYIRLDPRVRPLAMIVKFWTRERIINEASGGTLSSYTWTLLLINFLQTRNPPILPRLPTLDVNGRRRDNFQNDLDTYRDFGSANTETLGELLFNFYRRYGYEIDFEAIVMSVREAKLLSKTDKNWHMATNNRLCVEEPFSTDRNLGNTADDSAWRGLHLELRRAFDLIAEAKDIASDVCQHYDFLQQPKPQIERPHLAPRPAVLTRSLSQSGRSGRGGGNPRGGRQHQGRDAHRAVGPNARRASSAAAFGHNPNPMYAASQLGIPAELFSSQQQSSQQPQQINGLHDQFVQMQQSLFAREQELRQHAATIAQASANPGSAAPSTTFVTQSRPPPLSGLQTLGARAMEESTATAPLQPHYGYPYVRYNGSQLVFMYPAQQAVQQQGSSTNGASTLTTPAPLRRESQRNQLPPSPGASVRSHSQPARPAGPQIMSSTNSRGRHSMITSPSPQDTRQAYQPTAQTLPPSAWMGPFINSNGWVVAPSPTAQSRPREYLGYGFAGPSQIASQYPIQNLTRATTYDDLRRQYRQPSPSIPPASLASSMPEPSRSPSPLQDVNGQYEILGSAPLAEETFKSNPDPPSTRAVENLSPLIVNGSHFSGPQLLNDRPRRVSDSDDYGQPIFRSWSNVETLLTSERVYSQAAPGNHVVSVDSTERDRERQEQLPTTVENMWTDSPNTTSTRDSSQNGTPVQWHSPPPTGKQPATIEAMKAPASVDQNRATVEDASIPNQSPEVGSRSGAGTPRKSSGSRPSIPPLDLGTSMAERPRDNGPSSAKVLSPVQETRTPSPTSSRKRESKEERFLNGGNGSATLPLAKSAQQPPTPAKFSNSIPESSTPASATSARSPLSNTTNTNPWQQAGKKGGKKGKVPQGQPEGSESKSGGQPLPANISERKGG